MDLTDAQWAVLEALLPKPRLRRDRRGRPWRDPRDVLNGILWILRTGAPWQDLPDRYPSYQTCHRRFQRWVDNGTLRGVLKALAAEPGLMIQAQASLAAANCRVQSDPPTAPVKGKR